MTIVLVQPGVFKEDVGKKPGQKGRQGKSDISL